MTAQGGTGERVILDRVTGRVIGVEANPAQKPPYEPVTDESPATEVTTDEQYEWATACADCGDGPRRFATEAEARDQYEQDAAYEGRQPRSTRHTITLLRRPLTWQTVTTTAWEGRRDA